MYCPSCKKNQPSINFTYQEIDNEEPIIICTLCNYEFLQRESLEFEWDFMIELQMKRFSKIFFNDYFYLRYLVDLRYKDTVMRSSYEAYIDGLTTDFYKKWNLYDYYHIDREKEIKHHKIFEISNSPVFKDIFIKYFNIDINDTDAYLILQRDLKINNILS